MAISELAKINKPNTLNKPLQTLLVFNLYPQVPHVA